MAAPLHDTPAEPLDPLQFTPDGRLRHLLSLRGIPKGTLVSLLDRADEFISPAGDFPARSRALAGRTVANLFFEPSTRTRASFELAAKRLSADVLNLDVNMSSRIKGETILDTIYTLEAMQVDVFVVRDASAGVPALIARHVAPHVAVLNAGEAEIAHPTQGLLDVLTIRQHKRRFDGLVVTIVGDIAHSRVARSAAEALATLGVGELRLVSPPELAPALDEFPGARRFESLDDGLAGADVAMALRIQRERIGEKTGFPGANDYFARYGLTAARLGQAADDVIVMHPGPMNRGVEIDAEVADGPRSVIAQQVTNGLAVRMAVLCAVLEAREATTG